MPAIMAIAACLCSFHPAQVFAQDAGTVLVAGIAGKLNTKSAKVGDTLMAKTLKPAKLKDGASIPKGSQLIGTVVAVQAREAGKGNSKVAIKFDRIEVKGGATRPIQGRIASIGLVLGMSADPTEGSLMARGGPTATSGLSPQTGTVEDRTDNPGAPDAVGSSLKGVILGLQLDGDGANDLEGINRDIKLDSSVMIKVELQ